jgi:FkbM family methyltransferase
MFDRLIGLAMILYRRSPLYPRWGRTLARCLALVNRRKSVRPVLREIDGIRFELDLNRVIDASLYYSGTFEAPAELAIARILKAGMVALDIGANIGYHTFRMARLVGAAGRVIAVEPAADALTRLERNASLNSFANVTLLKVGLDETDRGISEVSFQSTYRLDGSQESQNEQVVLKKLDTLVAEAQLTRLDFIKLDVDGYEGKIFRGATATLRRFRPTILFELSPGEMKRYGDDAGEIVQLLQSLLYSFQSEAGVPIADFEAVAAAVPPGCSINLLAVPAS